MSPFVELGGWKENAFETIVFKCDRLVIYRACMQGNFGTDYACLRIRDRILMNKFWKNGL